MKTLLIARRDFSAYLHGYYGYMIIAALLLIQGTLYQAIALGNGARYSAEVLNLFFVTATWATGFAGWLLSMRSVAEERQTRTEMVLQTAPIGDGQIIFGKYLSVMGMVGLFILCTAHMPTMILIHGKISLSQVLVGYSGLLLYGSATAAIGIFASSLARTQVTAVVLSGGLIAMLALIFWLASLTEPPFAAIFEHIALFNKHMPPFHEGLLRFEHVAYFTSVTWLFLTLATQVLQWRRWQ
jgi:ABC-2 type transport system permease protein